MADNKKPRIMLVHRNPDYPHIQSYPVRPQWALRGKIACIDSTQVRNIFDFADTVSRLAADPSYDLVLADITNHMPSQNIRDLEDKIASKPHAEKTAFLNFSENKKDIIITDIIPTLDYAALRDVHPVDPYHLMMACLHKKQPERFFKRMFG